ncbi:MAG: hypothetical protein COW34_00940 [Armatimonadetes bacterium CG17_big_fil_post_rev_8_21_14_2_50_66_6]|nr:MAG: hypothetical protein COW34_00940 [Armatimonadetes bacterium CG17_big_fil_post_rev_8_21_14_2_50_66_6]PJB63195.1 MAG: hypothetical protein CO096_23030 [Armatimonadetes bacterium CG_4_9_14_3_um_filter_66_14]
MLFRRRIRMPRGEITAKAPVSSVGCSAIAPLTNARLPLRVDPCQANKDDASGGASETIDEFPEVLVSGKQRSPL